MNHSNTLIQPVSRLFYLAVIAGLRAKADLDVVSDPNWSKAEGGLHRRSQDLLCSHIAFKRENAILAIKPQNSAIENQTGKGELLEVESS